MPGKRVEEDPMKPDCYKPRELTAGLQQRAGWAVPVYGMEGEAVGQSTVMYTCVN